MFARITFVAVVAASVAMAASGEKQKDPVTVIGFGSCSHQSRSQNFWDPILATNPDYFIFGGDNIYSDTYKMDLQWSKYQQLASHRGFQKLKQQAVVMAVWDDHDYGLNDSGAEFREKAGSRENFLNFWDAPPHAARRDHAGIYDSVTARIKGHTLQFILLDTRYFRSELVKREKRGEGEGRYGQNNDPGATILGEEQWKWLEKQLREPADVRILVSSIQILPEDHYWESWNNFPAERQKLFELIKETKADGLVIISGDRHMAELTLHENAIGYPLYELTSSGLNMARGGHWPEPNRMRVGNQFFENNFGLIEIAWGDDPVLNLRVMDLNGKPVIEQSIALKKLSGKRR